MNEAPKISAVLPAAGQSRRMGQPKQLLPVHDRPMLVELIEKLYATDIARIAVVITSQIESQLLQELGRFDRSRVQTVINDDAELEMIDSIRLGLHQLQILDDFEHCRGIMVCPADHPDLSVDDLLACLTAFRGAIDQIIIASRDGKRGHPIIFPVHFLDFVFSEACDFGLNALHHRFRRKVMQVPCQSVGVLKDVDTPDDLQSL